MPRETIRLTPDIAKAVTYGGPTRVAMSQIISTHANEQNPLIKPSAYRIRYYVIEAARSAIERKAHRYVYSFAEAEQIVDHLRQMLETPNERADNMRVAGINDEILAQTSASLDTLFLKENT